MECQRTQDLLSDYIDGALKPEMATAVDAHIVRCESCALDLKELRQTVSALRSVPALDPPSYFVQAVRARLGQESVRGERRHPAWLRMNRRGLLTRLAAACVLALALTPPVRNPAVNAGWSLVWRLHLTSTPPPHLIATPPTPPVLPPAALSGSAEKPDLFQKPAGFMAPQAPIAPGQTAPPVQGFEAPIPIHRPDPPDVALRFAVDGFQGDDRLYPGTIINVSIAGTSRIDLLDTAMDASLSPGATFVDENGQPIGDARQIWAGNFAGYVRTSTSVLLKAGSPGLYDLRVVVHNGAKHAAADLLIPIGIEPGQISIATGQERPTDLYTALTTLAWQTSRPVAVEEGLTGTAPVTVKGRDFQQAASDIASMFGCDSIQQNGIVHVLLHRTYNSQAESGT